MAVKLRYREIKEFAPGHTALFTVGYSVSLIGYIVTRWLGGLNEPVYDRVFSNRKGQVMPCCCHLTGGETEAQRV